jgi:hypothetical protein
MGRPTGGLSTAPSRRAEPDREKGSGARSQEAGVRFQADLEAADIADECREAIRRLSRPAEDLRDEPRPRRCPAQGRPEPGQSRALNLTMGVATGRRDGQPPPGDRADGRHRRSTRRVRHQSLNRSKSGQRLGASVWPARAGGVRRWSVNRAGRDRVGGGPGTTRPGIGTGGCRRRSAMDRAWQRRRWDSNPRYPDGVHRFSRPALSTTQAPLLMADQVDGELGRRVRKKSESKRPQASASRPPWTSAR